MFYLVSIVCNWEASSALIIVGIVFHEIFLNMDVYSAVLISKERQFTKLKVKICI